MDAPKDYAEYVLAAWGLSGLVLGVVVARALVAARAVRARLKELEGGE